MDKRSGLVLICLSVFVSGIFILVSLFRSLTTLENTLFQVFTLGIGLVGSYVLGKESAKEAARDVVRPHALSAFRRLVALTQSLSRLLQTIGNIRQEKTAAAETKIVLDRIESIVTEQLATSADALEDWRDILPDEVDALMKRSRLSVNQSSS